MPDTENPFLASFSDPEKIINYHDGPLRFTPGFEDLHRMMVILLAEHVPEHGRVLVLGAGGGLELKAMASTHPKWQFEGVDPAGPMLDLARRFLCEDSSRVNWVEGYIDNASAGPFDGATCLLTLHFLDEAARINTLESIRSRLKPGAPLVVAQSSFPQGEDEREKWLSRYAAFAVSKGAPPEMAETARDAVSKMMTMLTPDRDEATLVAAGFSNIELFYTGFTWRGWVATA